MKKTFPVIVSSIIVVIIVIVIAVFKYQSNLSPPAVLLNSPSLTTEISLPPPTPSLRATPDISPTSQKPRRDLSAISVSIHPPLHAMIIGPQSKKFGFDIKTQTILKEFPEAWYGIEMQTIPPGSQEIAIDHPPAGEYLLKIFDLEHDYRDTWGTSSTALTMPRDYRLYFYFHDLEAEPFVPPPLYGVIQPGETHEYIINYSPEPGAKIEVRRIQ